MKLGHYVELNPQTFIKKGATVPFISMDVIRPGVKSVYPRESRIAAGSGSKFAPGDTLFARITPCLQNGKIAQYSGNESAMGSTEFFVLRARPGISDPDFIYYFSQLENLRLAAERSMVGASGRQRANICSLSDFECFFPPLEEQKKIANILSLYDELIENSERRIAILQSITKNIYKEWFISFRYPGSKQEMLSVNSENKVPENWRVKRFGDVIELKYGKALVEKNRNNSGEIPVYGSSGVIGYHDSALSKGPGIIIGRKGNVGSIFWSDDDFYVIDTAYYVSSSIPLKFLKYLLPTLNFINSAAAVPGLSRDQAYSLNIVVPPEDLINSFIKTLEPMEDLLSVLQKQIGNLRKTRNQLISWLLKDKFSH